MLHVDPNRRISVSQVLLHSFIARPDQLPEYHLSQGKDYKFMRGAMSAMFRYASAKFWGSESGFFFCSYFQPQFPKVLRSLREPRLHPY